MVFVIPDKTFDLADAIGVLNYQNLRYFRRLVEIIGDIRSSRVGNPIRQVHVVMHDEIRRRPVSVKGFRLNDIANSDLLHVPNWKFRAPHAGIVRPGRSI